MARHRMAGADGDSRPLVAVLMPAYQAEATVGAAVARTRAALPEASVLVIDDGSTDRTAVAAARSGAIVVGLTPNRGKGAALAAGLERGLSQGATAFATIDADGQHPPEFLPRLLESVLKGTADLVLGARARSGAMPVGRRFTNWLSATLASRIGAIVVPDAQTGFRAFSRRVAIGVRDHVAGYRRYEYEAAFLLAAMRAGFGVQSIEIPTIYEGAPSHFRGWSDSWRLARVFARYLVGAS